MKDYMKDYREIVPDKKIRLDLEIDKILNSNMSDDAKEKMIEMITEKIKKELGKQTSKKRH